MSMRLSLYRREVCIPAASVLLVLALAVFGPVPPTYGAPIPTAHPLLPLTPVPASVGVATDTVPASNSIVELILAPPGVWAATGRGVSRYSSTDATWRTLTLAPGLGEREIPALQVFGNQIWAATSHSRVIQEQTIPWGDGLYMSTDGGESWVNVSPDSGQASGAAMLAYDLASFRGAVVAACFAGGLVITTDQGQTWKNIFTSKDARSDFVNRLFQNLNNRFFSVVTDTTVAESLTVYAGTAAGVNKFVYLPPSLRMTGFDFRKLALSGNVLYVASERGLARTPDRGDSWQSFYQSDGLPTDLIGTIMARGDTIIAGADSISDSVGAGLVISLDSAASWHVKQPPQTLGRHRRAASVVSVAGAWWAACMNGGLIRSADRGETWKNIFPDSSLALDFRTNDVPAPRNRVNALLPVTGNDTTTLYAGTDDGIIAYRIPNGALPEAARILAVGQVPILLGQRVVGLGWQQRRPESVPPLLWALTRPSLPLDSGRAGYAVSRDSGTTWLDSRNTLVANEVEFFGNDFYLASDAGLAYGSCLADTNINQITFTTALNSNVGRQAWPMIRSLALFVDRNHSGLDSLGMVWAASDSGLAVGRTNKSGGIDWALAHSNNDPFVHDLVRQSVYEGVDTATGAFLSLSGNFVTALGLQRFAERRIIWAGTQTTGTGQRAGISRSEDGGANWTVPVPACADTCKGQVNVWNFAFEGANVWVATSQGLLHSPDAGTTWETFGQFVDSASGATIDSTTEFYAVRVVGDQLWVGTANGLAILDKADPHRGAIIRRTFVEPSGDLPSGKGGPYATPVPFSPRFYDGVRFHYKPPVSGKVKITIYDFANNVVKTFADIDVPQRDTWYHETVLWDGRNGKGDEVAAGAYFFVIEYANGQTHWGKLAVIP